MLNSKAGLVFPSNLAKGFLKILNNLQSVGQAWILIFQKKKMRANWDNFSQPWMLTYISPYSHSESRSLDSALQMQTNKEKKKAS